MRITLRQVDFSYHGIPALHDLDLTFGEGITAVMGQNGAGKTTLLQLAAGMFPPSRGELYLDDEPYARASGALRRSLGFSPQAVDFPEHLTPRKLIAYLAQLRFLDQRLGLQEMDHLGVGHLIDRHFEELSLGEIRLVGIAQALMGAPQTLMLDEFTRNLGIEDRQRVFSRLTELAPGRVVLFSTHVCEDVEILANRVILLDRGTVVFQGSPATWVRAAKGHVFRASLADKPAVLRNASLQISRENHTDSSGWVRFVGDPPENLQTLSVEPTFEEAYLWQCQKIR